MTTLPSTSAVSTDADTAEAVQAADQWLEALGGAPVRVTNALKMSHPCDALNIARTFMPTRSGIDDDDELLVGYAESVVRVNRHWLPKTGAVATADSITDALICLMATRRADRQKT